MDFSSIPTPTLLATWENLRKGLDEVNKSLQNGTFHKVGPKGAAPPSQSGQLTLAFALAVHAELSRRNIKFKEKKPKLKKR